MLFTSYLLVTGFAMFFTSWISSRIGAKRTLMIGLALIVVFATAAALSGNVESIIGFRAGWGLGNALFISTALATIVGAASGGTSSAIILYEAALGLGIAIGPLLGGLLGSVTWRAPFFGTAALMAIGFIAITVLLKGDDKAARVPTKLSAPFRALGQPALALLAITALFYNIGFFVLLAYTPFPLGFDAMGIGFTFFGWGVGLAITSVWVAPLLTARLKRTTVLTVVLPLLALDLVAAGLFVTSQAGLVVAVIVGGLLLGILNTVLTECVMEATDLPRSVASSSYSAVRFLGGAIAPPLATTLADSFTAATPYYVAGGSVLAATLVVALGHRALRRVNDGAEAPAVEAQSIVAGAVA
jgi:predicted MFS family arabinose efflux permease